MSFVGKGIPPETLQQIRDRIDIVDVISRHVTLSKTGQNFKGLCPFHSEKSPSFSVSPSRQMFHCFGCAVGGDAITFLMKQEGLGFMEAVQELAQLSGVTLTIEDRGGSGDKSGSARERYQYIHTIAAEWFQQNLSDGQIGQSTRDYLEHRGMSPDTVKQFGLGYAPPGWNGLLNVLEKAGVKREEIFQSGLIIKKEESSQNSGQKSQGYDRFRDRVMFPIANNRGQVIAFGGRGMTDDQMPKYLNSPETPWFSKGRTLFGFDKTRAVASRFDRLILVEGYFDVLALYQAGIEYVAAPLGTALTQDHVDAIRRIVKTVFLFFDGDVAGVAAALRTLDLFVNTGISVKVMPLPSGDDPDTFIRSQGIEGFMQLQESAPTLLHFAIQASLKGQKSASIEERVRSIDNILRILQKTNNPIEKMEQIQVVSEQLGIQQQVLIDRYPTLRGKPKRSFEKRSESPPVQTGPRTLPKGSPEERDLVLLVLHGVLTEKHIELLHGEMFSVPPYRQIIELALQHRRADGGIDVESLSVEALNNEEIGPIVTRLTLAESHCDDNASHFEQCLANLERKHLQTSLIQLIAELRLAEQEHRSEDIERLVKEIEGIRGKKAALTMM